MVVKYSKLKTGAITYCVLESRPTALFYEYTFAGTKRPKLYGWLFTSPYAHINLCGDVTHWGLAGQLTG